MTRRKQGLVPRLFVLLGVLALVAAACSSSDDTTTTAAAAAAATTTTAAEAATTTTEAVSDEPIVVGGSLALTGILAPTAAIHKVAGDLFVETLNESGGLLGRTVVWEPLDDESVPDQAAAIYERVISEDGVDLIMGPYGTGTITAAMAVAEREGFVYPHHTASLTYVYTYACHFPTWPTGIETNITNPNLVYDALEESGNPPETIAFVMNEFPGTQYIGYGPPNSDAGGAISEAEKRGWEVVAEINFPLGTSDWAPIAAEIKAADPDFHLCRRDWCRRNQPPGRPRRHRLRATRPLLPVAGAWAAARCAELRGCVLGDDVGAARAVHRRSRGGGDLRGLLGGGRRGGNPVYGFRGAGQRVLGRLASAHCGRGGCG